MAALREWRGATGRWGWLSYVCTALQWRRRGLARALVGSLLRRVGPAVPVGLFGSAAALGLYRSLGFEVSGSVRCLRHDGPRPPRGTEEGGAGAGSSGAPPRVVALDGGPLAGAVAESDRLAYGGTDRLPDLRAWAARPGFCVQLPSGAYGFARPRHPDGAWLGPVVAATGEEAEAILAALLHGSPSGPVELLVPPGAAAAEAMDAAARVGFAEQFASTLMVRRGDGGKDVPPALAAAPRGERQRIFVASGFEYG